MVSGDIVNGRDPVEIPPSGLGYAAALASIEGDQRTVDAARIEVTDIPPQIAGLQERLDHAVGVVRSGSEAIEDRYRFGRSRLHSSRYAIRTSPEFSRGYFVAEAARFDPPDWYVDSSGHRLPRDRAEPSDVREARVAEVMRLNAQIRQGVPTLLSDRERFEGGTPGQDGFAIGLVTHAAVRL